jgi:hypothetical protein
MKKYLLIIILLILSMMIKNSDAITTSAIQFCNPSTSNITCTVLGMNQFVTFGPAQLFTPNLNFSKNLVLATQNSCAIYTIPTGVFSVAWSCYNTGTTNLLPVNVYLNADSTYPFISQQGSFGVNP